MTQQELKSYYAKDRKAWRNWLQKNHAKSPGIWLIYYKKDSGKSRVEYSDAVEEALCFGWIDSTMRPLDENSFIQRFSPRKPKSNWSALNKKRIEKLIKEGLMDSAGLERIELAKKNGSWENIDHVENLEIPPDLKKAFLKNKKAWRGFNNFGKFRRKQFLYRLGSAKLPGTRAKRIEEIITLSSENKKSFRNPR